MAYNTSHLQRTLDTWRKQSGREVDASTLRFISPMGFEHINFNGVIVFPFEHYRTQLLATLLSMTSEQLEHAVVERELVEMIDEEKSNPS
jgi:hypothetical protein